MQTPYMRLIAARALGLKMNPKPCRPGRHAIRSLALWVAFFAVALLFPFSAQAQTAVGMLVWRTSGDTSPNTREWTGSAFNPAGNSAAIGDLCALRAAEAPTRDEIIVVGRTSGFGPIVGEIWNGSTWSALPINPLGSYAVSSSWMADVAEQPCKTELHKGFSGKPQDRTHEDAIHRHIHHVGKEE